MLKSAGHVHLLGALHVPPFRQDGEQTAGLRVRRARNHGTKDQTMRSFNDEYQKQTCGASDDRGRGCAGVARGAATRVGSDTGAAIGASPAAVVC